MAAEVLRECGFAIRAHNSKQQYHKFLAIYGKNTNSISLILSETKQ